MAAKSQFGRRAHAGPPKPDQKWPDALDMWGLQYHTMFMLWILFSIFAVPRIKDGLENPFANSAVCPFLQFAWLRRFPVGTSLKLKPCEDMSCGFAVSHRAKITWQSLKPYNSIWHHNKLIVWSEVTAFTFKWIRANYDSHIERFVHVCSSMEPWGFTKLTFWVFAGGVTSFLKFTNRFHYIPVLSWQQSHLHFIYLQGNKVSQLPLFGAPGHFHRVSIFASC